MNCHRQSRVRGIITHSGRAGFDVDGYGTMDGNPSRIRLTVQVIEGDAETFDRWLQEVGGSDYIAIAHSPQGSLLQYAVIGIERWPSTEGSMIEIDYASYISRPG